MEPEPWSPDLTTGEVIRDATLITVLAAGSIAGALVMTTLAASSWFYIWAWASNARHRREQRG